MQPISTEKSFGRTNKAVDCYRGGYSEGGFSAEDGRLRPIILPFQIILFFRPNSHEFLSSKNGRGKANYISFRKKMSLEHEGKNYHNRDMKKNLWDEIGEEMGISGKIYT